MDDNTIYTVGHSNYSVPEFLKIVSAYNIQYIIDVRSYPYSSYCPHFNREELKASLEDAGVHYLFLGDNLGARPKDRNCYVAGKVDFERLKNTRNFKDGVVRLKNALSQNLSLALMCSEKEPIACHRTILISRVLKDEGYNVIHILDDLHTCTQQDIEEALQKKFNLEPLLFDTDDSAGFRVCEAYRKQEEKIVYSCTNEGREVEAGY